MPYSYNLYAGDGNNTLFQVSVPFIEKEHVKVYVDGVETEYAWANDGTVEITPAPGIGVSVKVQRETPQDRRLVDFQNGTNFTEKELDNATFQMLYIVQETVDKLTEQIQVDATGQFNALAKRLTNLADPINDSDAVTKGYIEGGVIAPAEAARDEAVAAKNTTTSLRDETAGYKDTAVSAKDTAVTAKDMAVVARDEAVAARDAMPPADTILVDGDIGTAVQQHDPATLKSDLSASLSVGYLETPVAFTNPPQPSRANIQTLDTTGGVSIGDMSETGRLVILASGSGEVSLHANYSGGIIGSYDNNNGRAVIQLINDGTQKWAIISNTEG
ncbi:phage tail fiber protein [Desulfovibrio oxyclinae]|uniref:phage tail fiber domain-containing protein n=1 Tax=Desulfovibrio oxyclinae TaxID=63560 RepID=UPI000369BDD5|nr:phage tail fiber protein [Desulfovibrio oxyclinae]